MHDDRFAEQFTYMRSIWQTNKYVFLKVAAFEDIYINYRALLAFFHVFFSGLSYNADETKEGYDSPLGRRFSCDGPGGVTLLFKKEDINFVWSPECTAVLGAIMRIADMHRLFCDHIHHNPSNSGTYLNSFDYSKPIQPSFLMDASPSRLLFECLSFLKLMSINDNPKVYVLIYLS